MMVQLTPEQHAEVESAATPIPVFDPVTGKNYRLISEETYTRLASLLGDPEEKRLWLSLSEKVFLRDGWADEPDIYAELDPRGRPRHSSNEPCSANASSRQSATFSMFEI
jgi:hypothetical protein